MSVWENKLVFHANLTLTETFPVRFLWGNQSMIDETLKDWSGTRDLYEISIYMHLIVW